jgi:hypothetical protein
MLTKIITAPFSALGSLPAARRTEQCHRLRSGSIQLQPQQEKLVNVGKALHERPQLKVIVVAVTIRNGWRRQPSERVQSELAPAGHSSPGEAPGPVAYENALQRVGKTARSECGCHR